MSNQCFTCNQEDSLVDYGSCDVEIHLGGQMNHVDGCKLVLCEICGAVSGDSKAVEDVARELLDVNGYSELVIAVRREIAILLIENTNLTNTLDSMDD